jgi:hypothetical protein
MKERCKRLIGAAVAVLCLYSLGVVLCVRAATSKQTGFPTDWSHRHMIFSRPSSLQGLAQLARDPRYAQQSIRRGFVHFPEARSSVLATRVSNPAPTFQMRRVTGSHRDWAENLGFGASLGPGNFPAKYSFQTSIANCANTATPDFVVFSSGLNGSVGQASMVAYDNLYSGCGGIVPSVYWAYNTGGQVLTSPVVSLDGKQVAFTQTSTGEGALVLLKWAASTLETASSPMSLAPVANAMYRACQAPCMTVIPLVDGNGDPADDQTSSAFPDYSRDIIWVGGSGGWLHKISGVFRGLPAEVTVGGFPKQVNPLAPAPLSSPVYDFSSGNVFVGDLGGYLYRVNSTTAEVTISGQLDHGVGLVAGPIVDSTAATVYAFASNDGSSNCVGGSACSAIYALSTTFLPGSTGTNAAVGISSTTPNALYEGDFDSAYQNSWDATGNLYVCGNTGASPTLYKVPINAGVLGKAVAGPVLSGAATDCSPVTDIVNPNVIGGSTEWVFMSVHDQGLGNGCSAGGCVFNFKIQSWQPSTTYSVGQQVLDPSFQIQVVAISGSSGTRVPAWSTLRGAATRDGDIEWLNQGRPTAFSASWTAGHAYAAGSVILDVGSNIQLAIKAGTSNSGSHPNWSASVGALTLDNTVKWRNLGVVATANLGASGGASGVVLDNTVGSSTLSGASQVYFSTLKDGLCGTSGIGGCAVQASQMALQ